jgi:tRNA pseudouridine55 synthase
MITEDHIQRITSPEAFVAGAVLLIDKPLEWTSFDVVNKIKWRLRNGYKAPKFKIGHAGTLDPLATGLLVICTGKFTKQIDQFQGGTKEYTGTIRLGKTTPSFDLETAPEGDFPWQHLTAADLAAAAASFEGPIVQTPPVFSAKQIDGVRAYEAARSGQAITMRTVQVKVELFEITAVRLPEVDFKIRCSKGTYIRSLANDFGRALNSGAYLQSLRRTASEPFRVEQSMTMHQLFALFDEAFGPTAS